MTNHGAPPPAGQRFDFNFDPKGNGFTREQFMAQADDMIDQYIDKIQRDPVSTPTLANAVLAVRADNWHELVAVFFATCLQRLAYMSERPERRAR